jgi:O-antigen/teichoic acid export membrane protein
MQSNARSFFWSFVNSIGTKGLSFLVFAVMGRLLTPAEFGVVAMATVICAVVDVIADLGLTESLVQRGDRSPTLLSACFFMQGGTAAVCGLVVYLVVLILPASWTAPGLTKVLPWMLLGSVFTAMSSAALADLRLRMDFMNMAKRNFAGTLVGGVVGIGAALSGHGSVSLAWMVAANAWAGLLVALALCDFELRFKADFALVVKMLSFSRSIAGARLVETIFSRLDQFFVGAAFGVAGLGVYSFAYRLYDILLTVTVAPIGEVLLSTMSRLRDRTDELGRHYLSSVEMCAALVAPVFLFAGLSAPYWVTLAFGPNWTDAIPFVQILLSVGAIQGVAYTNGIAMTTCGRPDFRFKLAVLSAVVWACVFFPGMQLGAPEVYAALTTAVRWVVIVSLQFWVVSHLLGTGLGRLWTAVRKPVAGMVCGAAIIGLWGVWLPKPPLPASLLVITMSFVCHIFVLRVLNCQAIVPVENFVRTRLRRLQS